MSHRIRPGFTLVEMLTVVAIIGILMAMLVPAIQSARERARQTQCINHQKELASAMTQYETAKEQFPGYLNPITALNAAGTTEVKGLGWLVPLLPYLSRNDLWKDYRDPNVHWPDKPAVELELAGCPSNYTTATPSNPAPLAYVVNCGMVDGTAFGNGGVTGTPANPTANPPQPPVPPDFVRNGVFHNLAIGLERPTPTTGPAVRVSSTDIKDGTSQTLMLSESLQASQVRSWAATIIVNAMNVPPMELSVGFMWQLAPASDSDVLLDAVGGQPMRITSDPPVAGQVSSNHSGGVIVTFCDGHTQFLRNDISYRVYQHLMTPNGSEARRQETGPAPNYGAKNPANLAGGLSEGDYK